jgi:Ni/Co efflux regulator RcnB
MKRVLAIAAMFALAVPTLAVAEGNNNHPGGGKPGGAKPAVQPHGPVGGAPHPGGPARGAPHPGGPVGGGPRPGGPVGGGLHPGVAGAQFGYHGHMVNRVHLSPFVYPNGWAYRRWGIGLALPALFLAPAYYYADWAALGLAAPEPGFQWVRYGPDLLLVNVSTGEVVDAVYGAFYEG